MNYNDPLLYNCQGRVDTRPEPKRLTNHMHTGPAQSEQDRLDGMTINEIADAVEQEHDCNTQDGEECPICHRLGNGNG